VLVPERVGQPFHRLAGCDGVSVEVQLAVQLHERHRCLVERKDGEHGRAQMPAHQGLRAPRDRRDRGWAATMRHAVSVHDVLGFDARPHHDAHRREPTADIGQLDGERAL
jgi:hypothetical protein